MIFDNWGWLLTIILLVPAMMILGFAGWIRTQTDLNFNEVARGWEVFIKLISALTAIVAGALIVGKFIEQREASELRNASLQQAKILQSRLDFDLTRHQARKHSFREASRLAARIANTPNPAQKDISRFDELYYADLIGLEGKEVTEAMICFRNKFKQEQRKVMCADVSLERHTLNLSTAVKNELIKSEKNIVDQQEAISKVSKLVE